MLVGLLCMYVRDRQRTLFYKMHLDNVVALLILASSVVNTGQNVISEGVCDDFYHLYHGVNGQTVLRTKHGDILTIKTANIRHAIGHIVEATDGSTVIYAAMQGSRILACHLDRQQSAVTHFLGTFSGLSNNIHSQKACLKFEHIARNIGGREASSDEWREELLSKEQFHNLKSRCENLKLTTDVPESGERSLSGIRQRRAVSLIFPETRWCGVGNMSTEDQMYGNIVEIDLCCQEHDQCEYTIEGFTKKYKLFNYRFHTISHCECDDRFRSCLRATRTEAADVLGRLYFHVIGMKCFVFQRETECEERTWWGSCIRERRTNQFYAEIRGPLTY